MGVQILCSYRAHLMIYIKMCAFWAKFFPLSSSSRNIQSLIITVLCLFLFCIKQGSAIKCWECNSKHDPRCADPFQNFSIALVDCDQKAADVTHLMDDEKYTVDTGEPKASICRKTYQFVQDGLKILGLLKIVLVSIGLVPTKFKCYTVYVPQMAATLPQLHSNYPSFSHFSSQFFPDI